MRKLKIDREVISLGVFLVILILELFVVLPFSIKNIIILGKNITKIKNDLVTIAREWPSKSAYEKQNDQLKEEANNIRTKFILPQQESSLISFISSESKNFNVEIKNLKPLESQAYISNKLGKFSYLPIAISAQGQFHNLAAFLGYLQNSKFFFEVKELSILSNYPYHTVEMSICGIIKEK
jgi:hypothetical protein